MRKLFDKVTVLYEGRQIFFGQTSEARTYFEELGFECKIPQNHDPVFCLPVSNMNISGPERQTTPDFLTSMTSQKERLVRPGFEDTAPRTATEFEERWKRSHQHQQLMLRIEAYESK